MMNSSKNFGRKALFVAVSAMALSGNVFADTATANLGVSAAVADNCVISTTGALEFGAYDPIFTHASSPNNSTGTISVTCTTGATASITMDEGENADTGSSPATPLRQMDSGTDLLGYFLYSDAGRTTVWGNTGVATVADGTAKSHTVYGRILAAQNVSAGSYVDTVIATVTF